MVDIHLDNIDRKLLNLVQGEFPVMKEPYAELGKRLNIGEYQILNRIRHLKEGRVIREISPVLDSRSLGYQSTLVAMQVPESQISTALVLIDEHAGVSHGYEREHRLNLWFTLVAPTTDQLDIELKKLTKAIMPEVIFTLPALKLFKISTYFDLDEENQPGANTMAPPSDHSFRLKARLTAVDKAVINVLQQDLPVAPNPFGSMASEVGMDVEAFLDRCLSLQQRGIMRRFGASLNHHAAGFKANAMSCWKAPPDKVDAAGQRLAALSEVSHCYERATNSLWPYNLFAMIHCRRKETCQEIAKRISSETRIKDYVLLFSTKEFKKTRVKYKA